MFFQLHFNILSICSVTEEIPSDDEQHITTGPCDVMPLQVSCPPPPTYSIVMDNLDLYVSVRQPSIQHTNKSIHWTHHIAVLDRIAVQHLPAAKPAKDLDSYDVASSLPGEEDQNFLRREFIVLGSRMLCQYLSAFSSLGDAVVRHIPHQYSKDMAQGSTDVSIFPDIQQFFKNLP